MSAYAKLENGEDIENRSRRAFLAASGAALVGAVLLERNATAAPLWSGGGLPAVPVLTKRDLLVPPGEVYVEWHADPTTAPLLAHLAQTTEVDSSRALVGGFIARRGDYAPRYIETAAVSVGDVTLESAVGAVTEWVEIAHVRAVDAVADPEGFKWRVTQDGWAEAIQLSRVDNWLLFTSVAGRASAPLSPEVAVEHYATLLAERASETRAGR